MKSLKTKNVYQRLEGIFKEHDRIKHDSIWNTVKRDQLNDNDKIISTTWEMKVKASDTCRERINARGFEKIEGSHYGSTHTVSPMTNETTIRIMFTLKILNEWNRYVIDINGAFLNGSCEKDDC
jgi:virulence-associated protein VapD